MDIWSTALFNLIIGPKAQGKDSENAGMNGNWIGLLMKVKAALMKKNSSSALTAEPVLAIIFRKSTV